MSSDTAEESVRRLYEAYAASDLATIDALITDDAVVHVPGAHGFSGDHRGKPAVWAYLGKVAQVGGGSGGFDLHSIATDERGHAVALLTGTIRDWVRPVVHIWQVRDSRLCEMWEVYLDQAAEDNFWISAGAA